MKLSRLVAHAVMLAISVGLAGIHFSGIGSSSEPHLAPVAADASVSRDAQTGAVSSVGMGRRATIIKPVGIPAVPMLSHHVVHLTVGPQDTVARIAQQGGIPEESVRWSNLSQLSQAGSEPAIGTKNPQVPQGAGACLAIGVSGPPSPAYQRSAASISTREPSR